MRIGITGGNGFIGSHLQMYLKTRDDVELVDVATRDTFSSTEGLKEFVSDKELIVHLAGVNRASDEELVNGNIDPAKQLVEAMKAASITPFVVYSSTTHAENTDIPYGKGKSGVSEVFSSWADENSASFLNLVIPHVFGEFGLPNYNSGTNTFCHHIANEQEVEVNGNGQLELIHVQDLVALFISLYESKTIGEHRVKGKKISVGDVVEKLRLFDEKYKAGIVPDLSDHFDRCLFNTYRSYLPQDARKVIATKHTDDRGWLVETVKVGSGGQSFVSTTKPGITRGNHFHLRKYERFFVLQGAASIKMRKVNTNEVIEYIIEEGQPALVDIPTLHTHNITNIGDSELITFFWTDEFFDPENSDTFFELVEA
ncbi:MULTISPECIES: NAD-dependent epimerase/dehydratase family protein [unclassified Oleiphilus]|uniref:polysaccharide biosynthesis C-terminal domain-containing protein n=1 Tax=unclassified Oleiphilus TaxID=2631174 RepID=UPI0007C3CF68|nr:MULTISPECIES: NAD-dependent epimerase/dehydratase family protein [unclassified Oleiphilus]KZZ37803.1 hypothetical protein A3757_01545 [Oleiphilus sp. HI0117]KZZ56740.1 hypothetical protein A3761_08150 [Oleiphilus sp. HI0123]